MSNEVELYGDTTDVYLSVSDKMLFEEVDSIIASAIEQEDPSIAMRFGNAIRKDVRVRGVALAKLLWGVVDNWSKFEAYGVEDNVWDVIESEMGVPVSTSKVYTRTWESIFANPDIPDDAKERLLTKPIRTLKLLPSLAGEPDVDWNEVASAYGHNEVRNIIKRIRGEATSSKTALFIKLDVRTGQLSAKQGEEPYKGFGVINLKLAESDEVIAHAIERLVTSARIIEA